MSFTIEANDQAQFVLMLVDEPLFIHALKMAPASREPMLNSEDWIVLAFAVWSKDDLRSVPLAIQFAKSLDGSLNLGLRPFEFAEEFPAWCELEVDNSSFRKITAEQTNDELKIKIVGNTGNTPIWLCLRDGMILGQHQGLLDIEGLHQFTRSCFAID